MFVYHMGVAQIGQSFCKNDHIIVKGINII